MNRAVVLATALVVTAVSMPASAQKIGAMAGVEVWQGDPGGHAIILVHGVTEVGRKRLTVELNTDTLTVRADTLVDQWTVGVQARGEYIFAGILPDYYVGGVNDASRGFNASYVDLQANAKRGFGRYHWLDISAGWQQWLLAGNDNTAPNFVLPPDSAVLKHRLSWTYWRLAPDASWSDVFRVGRRRVLGFAVGLDLGGDYRTQVAPWGIDGDNGRNNPDRVILTARQWAMAGFEWQPGWRLQLREWAGTGVGEDDLTRTRIGGMNPYVVPVAGLPWASFLSSTYVAGEVSQAMRIFGETELGFAGQAAVVDDPDRAGNTSAFGTLIGVQLFVDLRVSDWQVNASVGASPDTGSLAKDLILSGYLDVGTSF
ncbi:MAG: hypothetical protein R3E66_07190 [bacterium]